MSTKTDKLLIVMNVLAWITFIGLLIKTGAIIISYAVSIANPEAAKNLYMGLNLHGLQQYSFWEYTGIVSLMVAALLLEAYTAFLVTRALSKIKMTNPFTIEVSKILDNISYLLFVTWIIALLYNSHMKWLMKKVDGLNGELVSEEFIFLAGIVFVFAQIFKKGVELQTENELTV